MRVWLPTVRTGTGTDVFALRMAEGLRRAGHEPVVQWFPGHYELMPWALKSVLAPEGTDIVHAGSWQGFAFKREGIPLVVTEHHYVGHPEFAVCRSTTQMLYHNVFVRRCLSRSFKVADCIVAVSQNTAKAMKRDIKQSIQVISNWVDTNQLSPSRQQVERPLDRKFRVLFVGNPSRHKGTDLLPSYARLLGSEIELWYLSGLRRTVPMADMPTNMISVPQINPSSMADLYREVDAVVVLARYEAFGYVALEGMSCGLPVLGFNTTGTAEVCVHGETALLAPIGDLQALVGYTKQLIGSPELRVRLGTAGRVRAVKLFGEQAAIQQYIEVYERLRLSMNSAGA